MLDLSIEEVPYVSDVTELLYRLQVAEFKQHFKRLREHKGIMIWISALTQCPRKWRYMLKYPEIQMTEFRGAFVLGKISHYGLQYILESYCHLLGYDKVEREVPIEKKVALKDGREVLLTGRVDAVAYRGDHKTIYEIKTARSDIGIPHEHHILQLQIYMNLLGVNQGILLYVTPDRVAEFTYNEPLLDEKLEEMIAEFLDHDGPRYEWECNYCAFSMLCPSKKVKKQNKG